MPHRASIAVVGAGFSGVMTAIHLLWRCKPGERVYLVEKGGQLGPGLAYATRHRRHLVNVRMENMSAFADEPDHFERWVKRLPPEQQFGAGSRTAAGWFVRRELYGTYIQDLLRSVIVQHGGAQNLFIVTDTATALRSPGDRFVLETGLGHGYEVDAAVLALGNAPPPCPALPGYVANPWEPEATARLDPALPVLILGTGLTMVDVCLMLVDKGFKGPIHALSRRGLLPQPHAPSTPWADLRLDAEDRRSLRALVHAIRRETELARLLGVDWRCVLDAVRPHVQVLWQELAPADKRRFLRHVRPWWDIHRHRMAPPVAAEIAAMRDRAALRPLAGRLVRLEQQAGMIRVVWRPRRGPAEEELRVQRVIDCRGPGTDYARLPDPLVRQLLADGMARPDSCRLGLETTPQGGLVGADGVASPVLFGVGPLTRGTFWEITSVPDIRIQAEQVAVNALAAARRRQDTATTGGASLTASEIEDDVEDEELPYSASLEVPGRIGRRDADPTAANTP